MIPRWRFDLSWRLRKHQSAARQQYDMARYKPPGARTRLYVLQFRHSNSNRSLAQRRFDAARFWRDRPALDIALSRLA